MRRFGGKQIQIVYLFHYYVILQPIGKLVNGTIVSALVDQILKLLIHPTDLVRKKAVMVLQKVYKINPSLVPDYEVNTAKNAPPPAICRRDGESIERE